MLSIVILILFIIITTLNALADAFEVRAHLSKEFEYSKLYHILKINYVSLAVASFMFISKLSLLEGLYAFLMFFLIRFALFDLIFNKATNRKLLSIGNSSIYDIVLKKTFYSPFSKWILLVLRFISFWVAVMIAQNLLWMHGV